MKNKNYKRSRGLLPIFFAAFAVCVQAPCMVSEAASVSYLGPEGTYTQEATKLYFGESGDYQPQKTVSEAVQRVLEGSCEYAVIPQENTIGGPVYDYVDELLSHTELVVEGEVELPIRQALLAAQDTELKNIKTVYSHKQGIAQSREWLKNHLPGVEIVEVSSTAEGARIVSEDQEKTSAAIASAQAAPVYGLHVLAESIQQNEDNVTRFYVVSKGKVPITISDRMAFAAVGNAGNLPDLMQAVKEQELNLISVHDRPAKTTLGTYIYLFECSNGDYGAYEKLVQACDAFTYRYFGSFSVK